MIDVQKLPSQSTPRGEVALEVMIMPKDLNHHQTAFGGAILSYMDLAGSAIAMKRSKSKVMLKAFTSATFDKPIFVSERAVFYGHVTRVGKTSMTVQIEVWRDNIPEDTQELAGTAEIIYVAVGSDLRPRPVDR
ncbi:MAG: acyl-CoA thioesterase [Proteobacteria bacterium]|nr:acyl-CoA thioesterase [Pseudomonadota bacterium]